MVADLLALAVAKHGNVRKKQGTLFADPFEVEAVFVILPQPSHGCLR